MHTIDLPLQYVPEGKLVPPLAGSMYTLVAQSQGISRPYHGYVERSVLTESALFSIRHEDFF